MAELRPNPSEGPAESAELPSSNWSRTAVSEPVVSPRLLGISAISIVIGVAGGVVAKGLLLLIAFITGITFYGRVTSTLLPPDAHLLGPWIMAVPILGAFVIGLMARYGSASIRGHGIPEVMERILHGDSRISPKMMLLKPLSAAVAIGTGGPFGAEGPIIATGGAMGSLLGQILHVTADERKTLLAAGAAAGMAATFGTPVAAVLLCVELLLFEYRARSLIPVAFAACAATAVRTLTTGAGPMFGMGPIAELRWTALAAYVALGAGIGVLSVLVSRAVYQIEDAFERLPVHWMWWPMLGASAVGLFGWIDPRILGVGYQNIDQILSGEVLGASLIALVAFKFIAWSVYLGSGTSGGTLAPLFIIGGGCGALAGQWLSDVAPQLAVSPAVAALVGMAAIFAGASHALLASVVFAFEATRQPLGLLPLLAGCSAAYLVSLLMMPTSIMTERLARRGSMVRPEYSLDFLARVLVRDAMSSPVVSFGADWTVAVVRAELMANPAMSHQGFPVVDSGGRLVGVVSRRDILALDEPSEVPVADLISRPAVVVHPGHTLREAADHMVREGVGRLPVVDAGSDELVGIVSRSDLLDAHQTRLRQSDQRSRSLFARRSTEDSEPE